MLVLVTVAILVLPTAFGFSSGMMSGTAGAPPDFMEVGCTASGCHGDQEFATGSDAQVRWNFTAVEEGTELRGNAYEHDAVYQIQIELVSPQESQGENVAGFNLFASAGTLAAVADQSQVADDGSEATHVDASRSSWTVEWTAPAEGVVVFKLLVNDVDGDGSPSAGDLVYERGWFLTDDTRALPGAAEVDHDVHVGVPLPQYWLGLIALAGMLAVMLFAFVYIRFMSPHHTDDKDR